MPKVLNAFCIAERPLSVIHPLADRARQAILTRRSSAHVAQAEDFHENHPLPLSRVSVAVLCKELRMLFLKCDLTRHVASTGNPRVDLGGFETNDGRSRCLFAPIMRRFVGLYLLRSSLSHIWELVQLRVRSSAAGRPALGWPRFFLEIFQYCKIELLKQIK